MAVGTVVVTASSWWLPESPWQGTTRFLVGEAAALGSRLAQVERFQASIPMVSEATPSDRALELADGAVARSKRLLTKELTAFQLQLNRGVHSAEQLRFAHERYLVLRQRFHELLDIVDLFSDALSQRAEHGVGVLLRGLDVLARDGLRVEPQLFRRPPLVCYLDRGAGGAVRRAFTKLPGGQLNAVALVRLPRERLCGNGFASLLHEVGHQGNSLLRLPAAFAETIGAAKRDGSLARDVADWWQSKLSEALADLWACCKLGAAATLGLQVVLGRSLQATFHDSPADPHPMPWVRARLSAAFGQAAFPHPIWRELDAHWLALYPLQRAPRAARALLAAILPSIPVVARLFARSELPALGGRTFPELLGAASTAPGLVIPRLASVATRAAALRRLSPCRAFAFIALARYRGLIEAEREESLLRELLGHWAKNANQVSESS
jgi:hypothetical protein